MLDKYAAEKIASEYRNLGIQMALHNAGIIKTAGPVDKLMKALKGGGGVSKKKMLAGGAGGAGLLGALAALSRRGGAAASELAGPPYFAGMHSKYPEFSLGGLKDNIAKLTGQGSELPVRIPYAPIGQDAVNMSYAASPAAEDLLTQIMKSPAIRSDAEIASSAGIPSMFTNLMGKGAPAEVAVGPDILGAIKSNLAGLTGRGLPVKVPYAPIGQDAVNMSYATSPAAEDLLTQIMKSPSLASSEGAGGYSLLENMSGGL
jgi:hypothetical protein